MYTHVSCVTLCCDLQFGFGMVCARVHDMSKELPDLMILRICLQQPNYARNPEAAGKKMMWPGSNPDDEIDPQLNTVDELSVSIIDISNVSL